MIIDSQVHIWEADRPDRPWPKSGVAPDVHLPEPLSYDGLLARMREAGVDRAVLVPPSWEGDRNDYALAAARAHPQHFAVMGRLTLDDPASRALLPTWRNTPGMLGVRLTFVWDRDRTWLTDGTADWFWPAAETAGVPVMAIAPEAMPEFGRIAERHPGLRLIIDHMGLMQRIARERRIPEAVARTIALARHPNISVKVSGLPDYSAEAYPFRDMQEHIRRVVEAFGPQRCFWGTDLSRLIHKCSYREAVTFFTEEMRFLSPRDLEWIMGRGIAEQLGWPMD
jgi:predicted TIM-barrel fold metal-dependent hydrolase